MSNFSLPQSVTYWKPSAVDGNGDPTFAAGVAVAARWARKDGVFTDSKGDDHKTQYIIYADTVIPKRSIVALEDLDGVATPPDGARKIFHNIESPSCIDLVKHLS